MDMKLRYLTLFIGTILCLYSTAQNKALDFDGTDDYVETTYSGISGNAARTVEAWIKTTANCDPNNGGNQNVITDWGTASTGGRFTMNVLFNNGPRIEVSGSGLNSKTAVNDGNWHHIAVVYNPSATYTFKIFIDGSLDTFGNIPTSVNTGTANNLLIGKRVDNAKYFDGSIDEVRVYNSALPDSIIAQNYQKIFCSNPSGLVAYFKLNEGLASGSNSNRTWAKDYSGSNHHGTLYNFTLSGSSSNWVSGPSLSGGETYNSISANHCTQYTVPSGAYSISVSGTYYDTLQNSQGCDSILTIQLTIGKSQFFQSKVVCDSYTLISGKVATSNGLYYDTLYGANQYGCDSIILTQVTIKPSSTNYDTIHVCDSFVMPLGSIIKTNGWYADTLIGANARGCDSIFGRFITVSNTVTATITMQECDSAFLGSQWYTQSQNVVLQLNTISGCDSILTVQLSIVPRTRKVLLVETCDLYLSPSGKTLTSSGTFYDTLYKGNKYGCDSIIEIQLTIHSSANTSPIVQACDSFVSALGSVYYVSGLYTEKLQTVHGCDSTVIYDVRINKSSSYGYFMMACDSAKINGNWYTNNQMVNYAIQNAAGCDSLISVNLSIVKIDNQVNQNRDTLVAKQAGANAYLWKDCNSNATVGTAQSFVATYNGDFKVIIDMNSCIKESECYTVSTVGIAHVPAPKIRLYPNPNTGSFSLDITERTGQIRIQVFTLEGKLVLEHEFNEDELIQIHHPLQQGTYLLTIEGKSLYEPQLIIVQH